MSLRKQATAGLIWTFAQQFGSQFIGFTVSLVLARILLPEEFGLLGMIAVFMAIGKTLLNAGLTQSLIRDKNLDEEDYSTVFFFNLLASVILYGIIFFAAPLIADFYDREILTNITRVFCLTFIVSAFSAVQGARFTREMNFKIQALISIPSTIIGGVVGIIMAYSDYGVWSLVASSMVSSLVGSIQLWIYSSWTPVFLFNINSFKKHFFYGYKLTLSELLNTVFNNLYIIVIGKYFSAGQVGYYTRAETMKQLPITNISSALNKVTFPLFAKIQDDDVRLRRVYKQLMLMVLFIIAPVLTFLGVLAEPTFVFLFTEKWLPAVPYFQILCVTGILYPIHAYNLNVLKVKGRSDLFLKLEVVKKINIVIAILIAIQYGIMALLWAQVVTSSIAFFINTHYTGKFINYTAWHQTRDILPILSISAIAGAAIYFVDYYLLADLMNIIRILCGGILGASIYLLLGYFFQQEVMINFKNLVLKR